MYPSTEKHLPESERDVVIPEEVARAMREAVQRCPSASASGVRQKHATPVAQKEDISVVLEEVRPSATFGDRESSEIARRELRQEEALRKDYVLAVETGKELAAQWNSSYFAAAFPFSIPKRN